MSRSDLSRSDRVQAGLAQPDAAGSGFVATHAVSARFLFSRNRGRAFSLLKQEIRRRRIFARAAWPREAERTVAPLRMPLRKKTLLKKGRKLRAARQVRPSARRLPRDVRAEARAEVLPALPMRAWAQAQSSRAARPSRGPSR